MDKYLYKYVGKYRVKAHYDDFTNDYPRDDNGNVDNSFGDFYIACKNNIEIRHAHDNILSCYIPSVKRGWNILRKWANCDDNETALKNEKIIDVTITDGEIMFEFKADLIDELADLVGIRTNGANISPLSVKNLPKTPYHITDSDLIMYKNAVKDMPMLVISNKNADFIKAKGIDKTEMRKQGLKCKEFMHKNGYWNEYCDFLNKIGDDNE